MDKQEIYKHRIDKDGKHHNEIVVKSQPIKLLMKLVDDVLGLEPKVPEKTNTNPNKTNK